ncbi:hypothetical protein L4O78_002284 [Pseudomonas aeruginosa]|uniref:hypothetical protein n=1 Tax=Pseudomonas aeruginosa TaxID=287 RepID=UPI00053DD353|nr:hypothetical protein [Pseudomonas aeruginosa]MDG0899436.1 hypothetical protein [Pseudomonas sp. L01]EIU2893441.1 hypothetical protein [Pseudomonas aeruginosa]EIU2920031.1 hypothetical protein [Pseudomonas aeruginosa]EIU5251917.1 hypothetical protein [Pseudomonas aeruginosa]EKU4549362.1 hypothetical protein [Pseudomonas aeruginosa]
MEFFAAFSLFSLGLYSALGIAALIALYLTSYGARCADSWLKGQPMPTDRVKPHIAIAALLGLIAGSFVQGIIEENAECNARGQNLATCLFERLQQQ